MVCVGVVCSGLGVCLAYNLVYFVGLGFTWFIGWLFGCTILLCLLVFRLVGFVFLGLVLIGLIWCDVCCFRFGLSWVLSFGFVDLCGMVTGFVW